MEILIIIGIIALIFYGYFQAKKQDTILIDDSFGVDHSIIKITDPYKELRENPIIFLTGMTPKQYGEIHGNGKSRVKKSNRLKLRK